ncbi:DUF5615 family PIN-like protein [Thermus tengchongensis]|uniref:DUF5615 family PIN-like protein n=1 Tax=Thermus tengchongensis TaxID=1214928 RepID=UPI001F2B3A05|nr:DUF5615 family PIN-like protein [Thermus tengchongensis]
MRFLADENLPLASVHLLRNRGFVVLAVVETSPGIPDGEVWALAAKHDAVLLTLDLDFGQLYQSYSERPAGLVLFRLTPAHPEEPARLLLQVMAEGLVLEGHLTVLGRDKVRSRPWR